VTKKRAERAEGLTLALGHNSPVGDFIPADQIVDPQALELWYKINGETKQSDSTELMLYKIDALIAHCSSIMTLEEGDLLLTGSSRFPSSPDRG
jgi:2-keto-4-pentenoate hydratase/2-oxohepta-3-ene-1,7-dioic acid hydratase in catechol pathway